MPAEDVRVCADIRDIVDPTEYAVRACSEASGHREEEIATVGESASSKLPSVFSWPDLARFVNP